jgi:hypothetical protein
MNAGEHGDTGSGPVVPSVLTMVRSTTATPRRADRIELARLIMRLRRLDDLDPALVDAVGEFVDNLVRFRGEFW